MLKEKFQKVSQKLLYWISVAAVAIVIGVGLQMVQAWTEPSGNPPTGDVGAPITTGAIGQGKTGPLTIAGLLTAGNDLNVVGNVGVGTNVPLYKLDVRGKGYFATEAGTNQLTLGDISHGTTSSISTNNNNISFKPNGSDEKVSIASDGSVNVKENLNVGTDDMTDGKYFIAQSDGTIIAKGTNGSFKVDKGGFITVSGIIFEDGTTQTTAGSSGSGSSHGSVPFATPGTFNWTVPNGVTSVTFEVWGGGGGGAAGRYIVGDYGSGPYQDYNVTYISAGGSGGSGGYAVNTMTVAPGNVFTITVGDGGLGGTNSNRNVQVPPLTQNFGGIGGQSSVKYNSGVTVLAANGGGGGVDVDGMWDWDERWWAGCINNYQATGGATIGGSSSNKNGKLGEKCNHKANAPWETGIQNSLNPITIGAAAISSVIDSSSAFGAGGNGSPWGMMAQYSCQVYDWDGNYVGQITSNHDLTYRGGTCSLIQNESNGGKGVNGKAGAVIISY